MVMWLGFLVAVIKMHVVVFVVIFVGESNASIYDYAVLKPPNGTVLVR